MEACFIQETKISYFNDNLASSFWGSSDVDWTTSNSDGASRGLVILRKKGSLVVNYSFIGQGFVGINILWQGYNVNLVNIYAPCSVSLRRVLWNRLIARRAKGVNEV